MARRFGLVLLLAVGCFGEPSASNDCPEGEPGCPCAPSGCDPGLVCEASVGLCIPENCIPGSELCTCSDGLCLTGLVCDGKLCRPGEGGETIATTSEVESSTLATTSSESSTSAGSTGTSSDGAGCRACILENDAPGGQCQLPVDLCTPEAMCADLMACIEACVAANDPECVPGCCTMHAGGAASYGPVGSCNAVACSQECGDFALYCPT